MCYSGHTNGYYMESDIVAMLTIFVGCFLIAIVLMIRHNHQRKNKLLRKELDKTYTRILDAKYRAINNYSLYNNIPKNHTKKISDNKTHSNQTIVNSQYTIDDDLITNVIVSNINSTISGNYTQSHNRQDSSSSSYSYNDSNSTTSSTTNSSSSDSGSSSSDSGSSSSE